MAGGLCCGSLTIDTASILDNLAVGFSSVTAELTSVPAVFSSVVSDVTTQLSVTLQDELVSYVEPRARPVVEEQCAESETFAPAFLLPIQAALVRNRVQETFQGFINAGSQFFV